MRRTKIGSITSVHPPHASTSPGSGNPATGHSVERAGCSSPPPQRWTCSTAHSASSFSPGRGFAQYRSCPHARHGGCATTGQPPGHVSASRSMSYTSHPASVLYTLSSRAKSTAIGLGGNVKNLALCRHGNWWRASSCLAADQQDRGKKSIRLPILLAPYLFCLRAAFL